MYQNTLADYESVLASCRFCPMCKPASEVANVTCMESHSTRSRAILLWRWLKGIAEPTVRDVELLYQSTLDSISESWCISHYPVSAYSLAGRRRLVAEGRVPAPVRTALDRSRPDEISGHGSALFVAGEIWELADRGPWLAAARSALDRLGVDAAIAVLGNGVIDFALGDNARARTRVEALARVIAERRPQTIIADGSDTLFALSKLGPGLGVTLDGDASIVSLVDLVTNAPALRSAATLAGQKVLCHDTRSATFLADKLAEDGAIQPGFTGPEEVLGRGAIYDRLRDLARAAGGDAVGGVWTRSLAKSAGTDDGLWLTYPRLAEAIGRERLAYAKRIGANAVITDSPLAAAHLRRLALAQSDAPAVHWIGELWRDAHSGDHRPASAVLQPALAGAPTAS